ncbi:MAG: hypothetical protein JXB38_19550 [Anaerolineales bacterium]|nr:hypothetical protein [Anaerolineales bacterium]
MSKKAFRPRNFLVVIMLLVLAAVAYGFAATNTVAVSSAGDGAGTVSGYDIDNIHYTLDATDPTDIDGVSFDMTGASAAQTVYIQMDSYVGWFTCTMSGTSATCDTTSATVPVGTSFTELRVVAAQ